MTEDIESRTRLRVATWNLNHWQQPLVLDRIAVESQCAATAPV
jgi:hypothetical protein